MAGSENPCIFCQIARSSTSTPLLHSVWTRFSFQLFVFPSIYFSSFQIPHLLCVIQDDQVVGFADTNPSAFRHYLVISIEHIPTVKDLRRRTEDYKLVSHMLDVGRNLLRKDAPESKLYRFGFHQPPFNSVNHLHLHCFALPFIPRWKHVKYLSLGPLGGFIEIEKLLERIKPLKQQHM